MLRQLTLLLAALLAGPSFAELPGKVLMVTAEQTGVFNTGGLGHTVQGLAKAMHADGTPVEVLMPYYSDLPPEVQKSIVNEHQSYWATKRSKDVFDLYSYTDPKTGVKTWLMKHPFFDNRRENGGPKRYTAAGVSEGEAFGLFSRAAMGFVQSHDHEIINLHDWHTALVAYLIDFPWHKTTPGRAACPAIAICSSSCA